MTREEANFIGAMNMCDEISNEAYKKIMCHCEEQEPIIDKIRAEIEQLSTTKCTETHIIYIDADDFKENVLAILDKHKAETENT